MRRIPQPSHYRGTCPASNTLAWIFPPRVVENFSLCPQKLLQPFNVDVPWVVYTSCG